MSFPKESIRLDLDSFQAVGQRLLDVLKSGVVLRLDVREWRNRRTLDQNALSHVWYEQISNYLVSRGRHTASPEWVKDALKHTYLGYEDVERIDVITGQITTVSQLRHTSDLKTGEMHEYLCNVEAWARDIGCLLNAPDNCEFMQLRHQQNQ